MRLKDKVALVSGAARGMGYEIAALFAREGAITYAGDIAGPDHPHAAGVENVRLDVSREEDWAGTVETILARHGRIDVLVNNAGIIALSPLAETDDDDFDRLVAVNLKGSFNTMREAARRLRAGGRVINFSSSVVGLRQPSYGIYAATKAGIEALTSVLAKELRGRAITVNAIAPGPTATDLFLTGKSAELIEHYTRMAPLERLGTPEDIAAAVAFLASPDGGWINGQTLRANGGLI